MPGLNRIGVSRSNDEFAAALRENHERLHPRGSASLSHRRPGSNREELQAIAYLSAPVASASPNSEAKIALRNLQRKEHGDTIRDIFTEDIDTIWVDERSRLQGIHGRVMPRFAGRIVYDGTVPMFPSTASRMKSPHSRTQNLLPYGGCRHRSNRSDDRHRRQQPSATAATPRKPRR